VIPTRPVKNRRQQAQILQKAGKGLSGAGQMIEMATDFLDQPRVTDLVAEDAPGPTSRFRILGRLRDLLRRRR